MHTTSGPPVGAPTAVEGLPVPPAGPAPGDRRPADLAERCYATIRDGILRRRFLPGERLVPPDLARAFGVSRTPVLEALKHLELEGLVEIHPRQGTVVTRVTAGDVAELADVRLMIEVHAAAAAVRRASAADVDAVRRLVDRLETVLTDDGRPPAFEAWSSANAELHRLLVQMAGNERLLKIYDSLHLDVRVLRVFRASALSPLQEFQAQHRTMLGALEARDTGALQHVVREHIGQATARALATLQMVGGVL